MRKVSVQLVFALLICRGVLPILTMAQENAGPPGESLTPPVKIPIFLSGNFGEPRSNHFHSGIDIKTNGVTGIPVISIADGHVSRIKVEPGGYGRALYVVHSNGYTSVYGHLKSFAGEVQRYVLAEQYRKESFPVDLFPPADRFPVSKGEVIALSGNTGSSGGPHLHFEIRETRTENPVNPLLRAIRVKDNIPPLADWLYVFSQAHHKDWIRPVAIRLEGAKGTYRPSGNQVVPLDRYSGLGISVYDLLDGSANKCGVYRIQAFLDDLLFFESGIDEFSFAETRYMNSYMDYRIYLNDRKPVIRLFTEPNNQVSVYRFVKNNGIVVLPDQGLHNLTILIDDAAGNRTAVTCRLRLDPSRFQKVPGYLPLYDAFFSYAETNRYTDHGIRITVPRGALYDDLYFRYESEEPPPGCYSRLHRVHRRDVPLHQYYSLALEADGLPESLKGKAIIAEHHGNRSYSPVGGTWEGGWLVARTRNFGDFCIRVDTLPPVIRPASFSGAPELKTATSVKFMVKDDFSGIQQYRGEIDGKWILLEYDPKNNVLEYTFDNARISRGTAHKLEIRVTDQKHNTATYSLTFNR